MVPDEIRAWNPETAPQAMVMKQNGKILPAKMGPVPSTKRVKGGSFSSGRRKMIPTASSTTTPSFTKVLRYPRGASKSHTGRALEKNPYTISAAAKAAPEYVNQGASAGDCATA